MEWFDVEDDLFWKRLLILGIFLNIIVLFTSDLGLDTHVRLASDESTGDLPWGSTRPIDSMASDPANPGTLSPDYFSAHSSSTISIITLSTALLLIGATWKMLGVRYAAIVSIYPTLIFATGRAYQEPIIALFAFIASLSLCIAHRDKENSELDSMVKLPIAIFGGLLLMQIPLLKGMISGEQAVLLGIPLGLIAHFRSRIANIQGPHYDFVRNPLAVAGTTGLAIALLLLGIGFSGNGGTLSIVSEQPGRYAFALLISIIDVIVIYGIFGMVLWPFLPSLIENLKITRDYSIATTAAFISIFSVAISIYVAALWTFEASIWNAPWPNVMWTMGNNGRYISMLIGPIFLLIHQMNRLHPEMKTFDKPGNKAKSLSIALLLILPISFVTAVHGQTMWTDEAGEYLADNMQEGEDFLFIHESTLGMHWLYTFHTEVNPDDSKNITGHWRAPESGWLEELISQEQISNRGNLSQVKWIVFSPELVWEEPDGEWTKATEGEADFLNGGGVWEIWHLNLIK